jgi:L-asparaginase
MQNLRRVVVVLGTGGTIAGTADEAGDNVGYRAAQLGAEQLVGRIPAPDGEAIEVIQVAQLDSKDMDLATWRLLAGQVQVQLARSEVGAVVITHGTDTLEETAYFLQRVLAPRRPVVLVAAMRPATALLNDGPQNLLDALRVARTPGAQGVVTVLAGTVHGGLDVRKVHTYRLDAFDSGDAGPIAHIEEGRLRQHRAWPTGTPLGLECLPAGAETWPRVEIITSHAGATAALVRALVAADVRGIVVAGTGNGSVHRELEPALLDAQTGGVAVLRCSRCLSGAVIDAAPPTLASAGALTPVQARIELMLHLLTRAFRGRST